MTDQYPGFEKDPFDLGLEYVGAAIKILRQCVPASVPGDEFADRC